MKARKIGMATGAAAGAIVIALSGAPLGSAATVQPFGARETLGDPGGMMVTAYTVAGLTPSSDVIPYRVMGKLYEAKLTVTAERGSTTPVIPPFLARSASGQSYRVLAGVPTALGINPMSLAQGQSNSGKLYFDVTGEAPNSVAYNDGTQDLLLWVGTSGKAPAPAPAAPAPAPATPMVPGTPGY